MKDLPRTKVFVLTLKLTFTISIFIYTFGNSVKDHRPSSPTLIYTFLLFSIKICQFFYFIHLKKKKKSFCRL